MILDQTAGLGFLVSLVVALVFTPIAGRLAVRFGILDHPSGSLKPHDRSTPYLGGLAIILGMLAGVAVMIALGPLAVDMRLVALLGGGTLILLVGLADDIAPISAGHRFALHVAICVAAVAMGLRLELPLTSWFVELPALDYAINFILSLIVLVGMTNAFNVIDVLDGLAAGVGVFGALSFSIIASLAGHSQAVVYTGLALAGASLGFLRYNHHPATIFMGDLGSTFLGFSLGGIGIWYTLAHPNPIAVLTPFVVLAIPILETICVMHFRRKRGMSVMAQSRDQFALRIVAMGVGSKDTVDYVYILAACLSIIAIVMQSLDPVFFLLMFLMVALALMGFGHFLLEAGEGQNPEEV